MVKHLYLLGEYETFGTLITNELSKLEVLEVGIDITDATAYMLELPHLKILQMFITEESNGTMHS